MGKGDTRQTGCSVTHLKKKGGAPKVQKVFDGAMRLIAQSVELRRYNNKIMNRYYL